MYATKVISDEPITSTTPQGIDKKGTKDRTTNDSDVLSKDRLPPIPRKNCSKKLLKYSSLVGEETQVWREDDAVGAMQDERDPELRDSRIIQLESKKGGRRKRRRYSTICTSNCKYEIVRRVAAHYGMKEVTEDSCWNLYWTDLSVGVERAKEMKRFQKVNHFPGMTEICRKDLLARNLNRMLKRFPNDYDFFPKTWCLPADHGEALVYAKLRRAKTFIVKPEASCQGRGIYLTKNLKDVRPGERAICQIYIAKPFLIDGYKFDFRIYVLITSCDPLRIYVYKDGLARFATSRYKEPTGHNTSNVFMHLTNYAINKHSRTYVVDEQLGSKRKISTLNEYLKADDVDINELWTRIDDIIIKTIMSAYPVLKHNYRACFAAHDRTCACFELLGFDVLLDRKLKPYLLEVNHSPSFQTDERIDKDIKEGLLMDTFQILNLPRLDKPARKIMEEDRKRTQERLLGTKSSKFEGISDTNGTDPRKTESTQDYMQDQFKWEDGHTGNFRRIYPADGSCKFEVFKEVKETCSYQDTTMVAAMARCRDEHPLIARKHRSMRIIENIDNKESKRSSLLTNKTEREYSGALGPSKSLPTAHNLRAAEVSKTRVTAGYTSFEPGMISEAEERERVSDLAQRDFLVKSYSMYERIYMAMRNNGNLTPADERKYSSHGGIRRVAAFVDNTMRSSKRNGAKPRALLDSQ